MGIGYTVEGLPPSEIVLEVRKYVWGILDKLFKDFNKKVQDSFFESPEFGSFRWIKSELTVPSFEYFTFAYKDAVFAALVDIVEDKKAELPLEKVRGLCQKAQRYNLVPCICPVKLTPLPSDESGKVTQCKLELIAGPPHGWGIFHARTRKYLNPLDYGKNRLTPMSEWELHHLAINVVRHEAIEKEGFTFCSCCDLPEANPQIWFYDKEKRRAWVIVRFQRTPDESAAKEFESMAAADPNLAPYDGYFAAVSAHPASGNYNDPLFRGKNYFTNFRGLIKVHTAK